MACSTQEQFEVVKRVKDGVEVEVKETLVRSIGVQMVTLEQSTPAP
jgi:hypothetical protein